MELCDLVVVTKADGNLLPAAQRTRNDYEHGLYYSSSNINSSAHTGWRPRAMLCSVVEDCDKYMLKIWIKLREYMALMEKEVDPSVLTQHQQWTGVLRNGFYYEYSTEDLTEYYRPTKTNSANANAGEGRSEEEGLKLSLLDLKRARQRRLRMWSQLNDEMMMRIRGLKKASIGRSSDVHEIKNNPGKVERGESGLIDAKSIERALVRNEITSRVAAQKLLDQWIDSLVEERLHQKRQ